MKERWITTERVVAITASVFLAVSFVGSLLMNGDPHSIIPNTPVVIPCVHALCFVLAFVSVFKPHFYTEFLILQIESILTILTNLTFLGIFFFYSSVFLFMCQQYNMKSIKRCLAIFGIIHITALVLTYTHGWPMTIISLASSVFYCSFFVWIYVILKTRFSCFTPTRVAYHSILNNKLSGSQIKLSDYKLNERQKTFIIENLHNNLSYKDLSEKYNVSLSTVKKEFSHIFDVFGVSKLEELHLLLLQFKVSE